VSLSLSLAQLTPCQHLCVELTCASLLNDAIIIAPVQPFATHLHCPPLCASSACRYCIADQGSAGIWPAHSNDLLHGLQNALFMKQMPC
jgi:hypothetical protein